MLGSAAKNPSDLLTVKDLHTRFRTSEGIVHAVDGVDLKVGAGRTVGLVGESGCGKSVTSLSIMRLLPSPPADIPKGEVWLEGTNLLTLGEKQMRQVRGNRISMIFQEPMTSLNPVISVGKQVREAILLHQRMRQSEANEKAMEALAMVGIPSPRRRYHEFPHQMSGGMRQRVMIAMALSCQPKLLIADEPTTALDVTIQAQILALMEKLQSDLGMAIVLITHDLAVVAEVVSEVYVMYAGKVVEYANTQGIFQAPLHPYTSGLIGSIPRLNVETERLQVIKGRVPHPLDMPRGCRFGPRCDLATDQCRQEEPPLREAGSGHFVRCWT